jgi:hypothetical protein
MQNASANCQPSSCTLLQRTSPQPVSPSSCTASLPSWLKGVHATTGRCNSKLHAGLQCWPNPLLAYSAASRAPLRVGIYQSMAYARTTQGQVGTPGHPKLGQPTLAGECWPMAQPAGSTAQCERSRRAPQQSQPAGALHPGGRTLEGPRGMPRSTTSLRHSTHIAQPNAHTHSAGPVRTSPSATHLHRACCLKSYRGSNRQEGSHVTTPPAQPFQGPFKARMARSQPPPPPCTYRPQL